MNMKTEGKRSRRIVGVGLAPTLAPPRQRRSRFLLMAIGATLAVVLAIWSFVFLTNPPTRTLDQRVQDVASQLKCPICQGESVADSPSLLAKQMRGVIRQQLQSGKSEQQVVQYFVDRYGQQIVWSPPWQGFTLLAWLVPIALLLGGTILLFFVLRSWRTLSPTSSKDLTDDDAKLENIDEADLE